MFHASARSGLLHWRSSLASLACATLAGCGGSFDWVCSPAPAIFSTPPTVATVGLPYLYVVEAIHECGFLPFICDTIEVLVAPSGTQYDAFSNTLSWLPPASVVGQQVPFSIRTEPDYCGDSVSQSWVVTVLPAPEAAAGGGL